MKKLFHNTAKARFNATVDASNIVVDHAAILKSKATAFLDNSKTPKELGIPDLNKDTSARLPGYIYDQKDSNNKIVKQYKCIITHKVYVI